jgi:hypothetical protein
MMPSGSQRSAIPSRRSKARWKLSLWPLRIGVPQNSSAAGTWPE